MDILILKTNIATKKKVKEIMPVFDGHPDIFKWSVDMDDIDRVLRIEASGNLQEEDVMELTRLHGIHCEVLPD